MVRIAGRFRYYLRWALRGFAAAVVTGVAGLFKVLLLTPAPAPLAPQLVAAPIQLILNLDPTLDPKVAPPTAPMSGYYRYRELMADGTVAPQTGAVVPILGQGGGWTVALPAKLSDKPTELFLEDDEKRRWKVDEFLPNRVAQHLKVGKVVTAPTAPTAPPPLVSAPQWQPLRLPVLNAAEQKGSLSTQGRAAIKFNSTAQSIGTQNGKPYYSWRVFVDEPARVLQTIRQVDYVLHPTFPEPFKTSLDRAHAFELEQTGWGRFTILITVHFVDGKQATTSYFLDLQKGEDGPSSLALTLEKIRVESDGSTGSTGWVFEVRLDGKLLIEVPNRNYDDGKERASRTNEYWPAVDGPIVRSVNVPRGRPARIDIVGKRSFLLSGDTVTGTALLRQNGGPVMVRVTDRNESQAGDFVFYFSASPK